MDFIVTDARKPILAVECKLNSSTLDRGLRYFVERFPKVEAWQVAMHDARDVRTPEGIRLCPASRFLSELV